MFPTDRQKTLLAYGKRDEAVQCLPTHQFTNNPDYKDLEDWELEEDEEDEIDEPNAIVEFLVDQTEAHSSVTNEATSLPDCPSSPMAPSMEAPTNQPDPACLQSSPIRENGFTGVAPPICL
jgi:hypothetical protein